MGNHKKDLTGKTVGWLTVVEETMQHPTRGVLWRVRCRCGKELVKSSSELGKKEAKRAGQAPQSCGCSRQSQRVYTSKYGRAGHLSGHQFGITQARARRKGFVFDVTIEYLWDRFVAQDGKCALTGVALYLSKRSSFPDETKASLDRIDSKLGYIQGNVQWVHPTINFMKHAMIQSAFIEWCKRVAEHH